VSDPPAPPLPARAGGGARPRPPRQGRGAALRGCGRSRWPQVCFPPLPADFKANLSKVCEAIEESDFLAIDGEFSGTVAAGL